MLLQCLSRHLTFVVIYWAILFNLKIHVWFAEKTKQTVSGFSRSRSLVTVTAWFCKRLNSVSSLFLPCHDGVRRSRKSGGFPPHVGTEGRIVNTFTTHQRLHVHFYTPSRSKPLSFFRVLSSDRWFLLQPRTTSKLCNKSLHGWCCKVKH